MDNFHIETAQNVTINQNVANLSARISAFLIDLFIIGGYYVLAYLLLNSLGYLKNGDLYLMYGLLSLPVVFYSLLFETLANGQSPGKYLSKIRVTKLDGSKPTFSNYLIRWMLRLIDIAMGSGSIAMLTILLNGKGQRLGDIAAGTTVISEAKLYTINDTLAVEVASEYVPQFPQVTVLSDKDIQTIKELFTTAKRKGNHQLILKIQEKVFALTGIKTEMNPMEFIETVIIDYNYYTQQM